MPTPRPAKPSPMPQTEVAYHQTLRVPSARWWKGLVVIALFVVGYLLISLVIQAAAVSVDVATGRVDPSDLLAGRLTLTPLLLLSVNLTNALAIPLSGLLIWGFYGQPVRWMHSVVGYVRWGLFARTARLVLPIWLGFLLIMALLDPPSGGSFTAESVALLLIVLLTTPLQAAGEEYGARGLITRAAGSWSADPRISLAIGTVLSAGLFTVAHGAGDPWLIVFYFVFGVAMSVLVWRTGGLEVAVVVHTVHNLASFVIAIAFAEDLSGALDRGPGSGGPGVLLLVLLVVGATALLWWWTGRQDLTRTFRPPAAELTPGPAAPPALPAAG
jgi:membrane protease YdiL (CAAX protease family)